jgi:periplasmic protein TonB
MGRAELFATIGAGSGRASSFGGAAPASLLLHAGALSLLVLVAPLWTTVTSPKTERDYIGILTYDPPPPPAAQLPVGSGPVTRAVTRPQVRPEPVATFLTPAEVETPVQSTPATASVPDVLPGGSPDGSTRGVVEGEEYGRDGGVVGGVPDGVKDGVIGAIGTGPVPVRDYDQQARRTRMVEPVYPPEAFAKKIQGTVLVEILIDVDGRVVRATVTRSVPQLDAAAVEAVRQWLFTPAMKGGRAVPSLATAPVRFTIY